MRRPALVALVATASSILLACAQPTPPVEVPMLSADDVARAVTTTGATRAAPVSMSMSVDGPLVQGDRLRGHYVCAQGRTELTLVIEDVDGDDVGALFEFDYPGGGGANVPASGSFRMRGSIDARSRAVTLRGERWIEQPDGYAMVGLVGTVAKSGSVAGVVKGPGCSTFFLDGPKRAKSAAR